MAISERLYFKFKLSAFNFQASKIKKSVLLFSLISFSLLLSAQEIDSIIDIRDYQMYKVVKIGQQWWMQENLNTGIPINGTQDAVNNGFIEKYCYDNLVANCDIYGGWYQWDEMMDYNPSDDGNPGINRGICPVGWHLPTDSEWTELSDFLGGVSVAGGKLKETGAIHWASPNTSATNETGFTALPGGSRLIIGDFSNMGLDANFWSSTEFLSSNAWYQQLNKNSSGVISYNHLKENGFSVRCLRDTCQFSYLTVSDEHFRAVSDLNFYSDNVSKELIIINSSAGEAINISSIYTKNASFSLDKSSSALSPGDSIHFTITFDPPAKDIYHDTLFVKSDDPFDSLITIPLNGTFPPKMVFTDSNNISCNGNSDGSATITPSLGTPPYQYQWDDPVNTTDSTVTGLNANIYYHITVTDNLGWTITDSIMLSEPDLLNINPSYSDTICLNGSNGFISTNPSGGTAPFDYIWSTGAASQNLTGLAAGEYSVKVTDSNGCIDSTGLTINSAIPYEGERICMVTVYIGSGENLIIWQKTPSKGIAYYNIYRENTLIGTVAYNDLSIIADTIADPEKRPYLYRLSVVDTCRNESARSPYHKPLFLQFVSSIDGVNLTWSKYEIEGEVVSFNSYNIYRGGDSTALAPLEEDIPTEVNVFTDNDHDALSKKYYYRVAGVLADPCYPTGKRKEVPFDFSRSMSNLEDNRIVTVQEYKSAKQLNIYPNPFSRTTTFLFNNPEGDNYTLVIMDLSGKIVRLVNDITTSKYVLDREVLKEGFYFIELRGPEKFRGKIVIE